MRRPRTYGLALAALALVMTWLYGSIDYLDEFAHVDLRYYRVMAQAAPGLADDAARPFAHRLLGPYLVGLLPVSDPVGFRLLTTGTLVLLTLLLYTFLLRLGLTPAVAAFTAALLPFNPYVFGFPAFNPFQLDDVLVMALIVLAFLAVSYGRWGVYALTLALGATAREPALLVIPAAFVYVWERGALRTEGRRWLLASLPALAIFVLLRVAVPAEGPGLAYLLLDHVEKAAVPQTWYRLLVNAWAPLSLLPLVLFENARAFARQHLYLIVFATLVLLSAMFGGDQERLVAPAFILVYPLIGHLVQHERWVPWTRYVLIAAALLTSLHHLTARFPLPGRTWTIALSLLGLAAATLTSMWVRYQRLDLTRTRLPRERSVPRGPG